MQYNVLIANRGLTALKFILSMKEWLSETNNIYDVKLFGFVTPVDMSSKYKYVTMLDQSIYTNNSSVYTNIDEIIHFCKEYKINCLFPGWGYLSENEQFVKALNENGILFLGPTYENMCAIGNKISCNDVAEKLGVPVLPWSGDKQLTTIEEIEKWCGQIGYPVMLKAGNSGGGKGIRIVREKQNCYEMWQEILQEVVSPMIYATKYIENASHLEIQILGDGETAIHLHGRDCTTQRRNQKLIEECPIQKDKEIVDNIQNYAVKIANHIGYKGLATVEFIYDQDTKQVYILEVNPRIQVEHIITEQLFGLNLIKMLFLVSTGTKLHQISEISEIKYEYDKHIISVRINSENPYEDFRPTLGKINEIDITYNRKSWGYFSIANDAIISETVDSQFGHISAFGTDRNSAIRNLTNLIDGLKIRGTIYNTAGFLKNFINGDIFGTNRHTTRHLNSSSNTQLFNTKYKTEFVVVLGMVYNSFYINDEREKECLSKLRQGHNYHLKELNQFSKAVIVFNNTLYEYEFLSEINTHIFKKYIIRYNGVCYKFLFKYEMGILNIVLDDNYMYSLIHSYHDDYQIEVLINQHKYNFIRKIRDNKINSPAGGKVIDLLFKNGDIVHAGDIFVKIECMKMILPFKIDKTGIIRYFISPGDVVTSNQIIGEIDESSSIKHEYLRNMDLMNGFCAENNPNAVIDNNAKMLISMTRDKQPAIDSSAIPALFSSNYHSFISDNKNNCKIGSKGYIVDESFVLLVNDLKINNGVFSYLEDEYYFECLRYARTNKMPFVFIASNSGADIKINENVKFALKPYIVNGEFKYFFLDHDEYELYKDDVLGEFRSSQNHFEIVCVNNPGIINLDGSALLVSEMAKARNEILTITFVIDRTVGVGAYLARLSERIVQRSDSAILLTGYQSINKVLGKELYESNIQLGGPDIMSNNGIAHKIVDTTKEGVEYIKQLLYYKTDDNIDNLLNNIPPSVTEIIDRHSLCETMDHYAKNVVTGRCLVNGTKYGIVYAANHITERKIPCDPADLNSANKTEQLSPNILYPDTSYKIAKTIRDCNAEGIKILILADWRGFSGGAKDMFDNVLDFGSMIVSELAYYKQEVTIYIPPNGQLRGGSMVVFSKSINREKMRFFASSSACINVLEPNATKELKYKTGDKQKYASLYNIGSDKMMETISNRFVELNDRINPAYKVLNKHEPVIDCILEPSDLRNLLRELREP